MDFDLSEEQRLLKESLERLIGDRYAFEQRKVYGQSHEGWSRELWRQYAELGLLGLPFAERYGGSGGGAIETMIAMEAFGRALALEPFLATVVLGGGFLRLGGAAEHRSSTPGKSPARRSSSGAASRSPCPRTRRATPPPRCRAARSRPGSRRP